MDNELIDEHTGLVLPPAYPCYQDDTNLCELRTVKDSHMVCTFGIKKGCPYSQKIEPKEDKPVQEGLI